MKSRHQIKKIDFPQLQIRIQGISKCSLNWQWDTSPGLVDYDLVTILQGSGFYHHEGTRIPVRAGSALLMRKGKIYRGELNPKDLMTMAFIRFDFIDEKQKPIEVPEEKLPALHTTVENQTLFFSLVNNCIAYSKAPAFRHSDRCKVWLEAALLELYRQKSNPRWQGYEKQQAQTIETLCNTIRENIGKTWRMESMAKKLNCTPDHLGRLFRKYVGLSPGEFIINTRIDQAKFLLNSSEYSVEKISQILGYKDVYAFSRQFKKKTQYTPTNFRKAG